MGPRPAQSSSGLPQPCRPISSPLQQPRALPQPSWLRPPCAPPRLCAPLPPPSPRRADEPPRLSSPPQRPRALPQPSWLRLLCAHVRLPVGRLLGSDPLFPQSRQAV